MNFHLASWPLTFGDIERSNSDSDHGNVACQTCGYYWSCIGSDVRTFKWSRGILPQITLKRQIKALNFWQLVTWKRASIGMWLLLNMYRKWYMDVQMVLPNFTLDDLERSNQGHAIFNSLHRANGACEAYSCYWSCRNPYAEHTVVIPNLTCDDRGRSNQGHAIFNNLYHGNHACY